ncbi:MAG: EAL domain-containing protein [Alphaproteobacteria bacterium]|nr:EAL domain-containing protein [Alphaproteobacteria bacterium]
MHDAALLRRFRGRCSPGKTKWPGHAPARVACVRETSELQTVDPNSALHKVAVQHLDELNTALWVFDIDHSKVTWANKAALSVWNADSLAELASRDMSTDMSVSVAQRLKQYQEDFIASDAAFTEVWTIYPQNVPTTLDVAYKGFRFDDGRMGMLCEARAQRTDTPEGLRSSEALLHTSVMISLYDAGGTPLYRNPAARALQPERGLQLKDRFVNESDHDKLISQVDLHGGCRQSARIQTSKGIRWHEITARECTDAVTGKSALLLSETDITDLKEAEHRARYLADHDTLTGLPNRNYVQSKIPKKLEVAGSIGEKLAFLIIDLDRFKAINDALGHAAGDELLIQVATRLPAITGDAGMVARLGGDEFLICLQDVRSREQIDAFCEKLVEEFRTRFTVDGREFVSTLSIGVSQFPEDGEDLHTLLKYADVALYEAKEDGRNTHCCFNISLRNKIEEQLTLERDLRAALEQEQFELFYQPRVDTFTNQILGGEALLRWNHPTRGLLAPGCFIEAAEQIGLIIEIGDWVLTQAAIEQHALEREGFPITVSVNISPKQFESSTLFTSVLSLADRTGCNPKRIELEITETTLMSSDSSIIETLSTFKERGFGIAIDDFGTGYSNLAYIQHYPVTSLKIDRSFIANVGTNHAVMKLIMSLCRLLKVKPVAEGVETEEQLAWLQQHGCREFQGFLYSPAVHRNQFRDLLKRQHEKAPSEAMHYPMFSTG